MLKRELDGVSVVSRTHYVGNLEIVWDGPSPASGTGEYRRYIGGVALVTFTASDQTSTVQYQHKDHLGSLTAVTDESGEIVARMAFDPWGQRRDPEDLTQPWEQWTTSMPLAWAEAMLAVTPRGYTGHEHLDSHGIVHMGGRIYDPHLGRFLQADPFVEDTTTLNRYTYVHNNPLAYTDPSGYLSTGEFLKIAAVVVISVYTAGTASGASWGLFGASVGSGQAFATVVVGGALSGAVSSGTWEGAVWGAFSAAAFYGFGQAIAGESWAQGDLWGMSGPGLAAKSVSHGIIGGTVSHVQGGKFGHGFISAGVTAAASPAISNIENPYVGGAVASMVGGTTSSLTGGKFANGATTAAMAYAFNQLLSDRRFESFEEALDHQLEATEQRYNTLNKSRASRIHRTEGARFESDYERQPIAGFIYEKERLFSANHFRVTRTLSPNHAWGKIDSFSIGDAKGAAALAVYRNPDIDASGTVPNFSDVSRVIDAPVFVKFPSGDVYKYTSSGCSIYRGENASC